MLPPVLLNAFPDLDADGGAVVQPPDPAYNCIMLPGWHRVLMNTESQSRAMANVAFLD